MQIRTSQFCALATSPDWQTWLYHYDANLYSGFMQELRDSNGCSGNRVIMERMLKTINELGGGEELIEFLRTNHPYVIKVEAKSEILDHYFKSGLLTFPRRCVIEAPKSQLPKKVQAFVSDKFKYDYLIVGRRAYIEYLTLADKEVADQIAADSWILARHKNEGNA